MAAALQNETLTSQPKVVNASSLKVILLTGRHPNGVNLRDLQIPDLSDPQVQNSLRGFFEYVGEQNKNGLLPITLDATDPRRLVARGVIRDGQRITVSAPIATGPDGRKRLTGLRIGTEPVGARRR